MAIGNSELIGKYPTLRVTHKLLIGSDHFPLIIELNLKGGGWRRRFRFEGAWLEKRECGELVKETWERRQGGDVEENINSKLCRCRTGLQKWSRVNGVNYRKRITELQEKLSNIQHRGDRGRGTKGRRTDSKVNWKMRGEAKRNIGERNLGSNG